MKFIIAPSILAADFSVLKEEISKVEYFKDSWVHLDIMDNHFVPNLTFGPCVTKGIRKLTDHFLDTHLMVENPEKIVKPFADIPVQLITFHYEETRFPFRLINLIKSLGSKVGISINPSTPFDVLTPFLKYVDLLLIMSVEPGFAGQKFIESSYDKIKAASNIRKEQNLDFLIEVDGGINETNIQNVIEIGANVVVLGSYFFENDFEVIKSYLNKLKT